MRKNQVILWNDLKLFYGSNPQAVTKHSHPVVQFVFGVHQKFTSKNQDGNWVEKRGLLIAPNHAHECDASHISILSMDIDPDSVLGEWILSNQLSNHPVLEYPSPHIDLLNIDELVKALSVQKWNLVRSIIENLFFFQRNRQVETKDERIEQILAFISSNIDKQIDTQTLMEEVYLSESRLLHLFKETMGLPIRNYILWYRLKIVLEEILAGKSLTRAAYRAGFADQAHLTRTFKKMIGVPPSILVKNSKFIQVSFPD